MKGSDYLVLPLSNDCVTVFNNKIFVLKLSLIQAVWNLDCNFSTVNFGLKPFEVSRAHACPCVIGINYGLSTSDW